MGKLSLAVEGPFVGRSTKMCRLMEIYGSIQREQTRIVTIKGEAGVGKTCMASEFLGWAATQGADVLQGRAFEAGGCWPYQPLVEMLELRSKEVWAQTSDATIGPLNDILSRVMAEMHNHTLNQPPLGNEKTAHKRLFEAFTLLGQALAGRTPVVLFIDDIHWADAASLDMLQYACRRWVESNTAILILLNLRTEALVTIPTFAAWLSQLERDLRAPSFIMNAFTLEETIQFMRARAVKNTDARDADMYLEGFGRWLYAETGGQPFYMTEMLKALFEQNLLTLQRREDGACAIDCELTMRDVSKLQSIFFPGVRAVIHTRLTKLTLAASALVAAGAVLGRRFTLERVCRVAGLNEHEGRSALDEVLARHLFDEVADHYFFTHDKIRDVVYAETAGAERRHLHRRALEVLRAESMPAGLLAYHAQAAELREEAFHLQVAAGDGALRLFALRDAVTFYEQALQFLVEQQMRPEVFSAMPLSVIEHLYIQLGRTYELLNEREHARATYQGMLMLAKKLNITVLACVALNQLAAISMHEPFDLQAATVLLGHARNLAQSDENACDDATETEWQLAQLSFQRFDTALALMHGERALQLARELGLPELVARALFTFAFAKMLTGDWEEVELLAEEARGLYEGQQNRIMEAGCLVQIAQAKNNAGQPHDSIIAARGAYLVYKEVEYGWGQIYAAHHLVAGLLDVGAYSEALVLAEEAVALARTYNVSMLLYLGLTALGWVQRALMDPSAAYKHHREVVNVFWTDMPLVINEMLSAELCADCAIAGEWAEAQSYATQALAHRSGSTFMYVGLTRWYETEILARTGYSERATADLERFDKITEHSRRYRIPCLRAQAMLALWRGEFEQTHQYLREALTLAEEIGLPGEQWSIEAARGELYQAQGDKVAALSAFERAAEIVLALANRIEDEQVRAKFLAAQQVQHVITCAG